MNILIAGDFCPLNRVSKLFQEEDYETVLGDVRATISGADYSIVNYECPVVNGNANPIDKFGPSLKCSDNGVKAIRWAGFDCVTLANNHFYDYGEQGVQNTLDTCAKFGIDTVGGGRNIDEAATILYKQIKDKSLAVINCCEHEFSIANNKKGGSNPLNPIKQFYSIREAKAKVDFVLVIVHGGRGLYQLPSPRMVETYRFFIDAGADAVVNHHQHCYSGYEIYMGKPIFYGLGNFCFDYLQYRKSIWNEGYLVCLALEPKTSFQLIPYVQCDSEPGVFMKNDDGIKHFYSRIAQLNDVIANSLQLNNQWVSSSQMEASFYKTAFSPYTTRIMKGLFRRGLLPSFMNTQRVNHIIDMVECESHREGFSAWVHNKE